MSKLRIEDDREIVLIVKSGTVELYNFVNYTLDVTSFREEMEKALPELVYYEGHFGECTNSSSTYLFEILNGLVLGLPVCCAIWRALSFGGDLNKHDYVSCKFCATRKIDLPRRNVKVGNWKDIDGNSTDVILDNIKQLLGPIDSDIPRILTKKYQALRTNAKLLNTLAYNNGFNLILKDYEVVVTDITKYQIEQAMKDRVNLDLVLKVLNTEKHTVTPRFTLRVVF